MLIYNMNKTSPIFSEKINVNVLGNPIISTNIFQQYIVIRWLIAAMLIHITYDI